MTYILILAPLSCPDIVVQKYLLIVLVLVLDFPLIHKSFSVGNAYGFVFWCFSTKIKQSFTQELFPMEARKWAHFYKYVYFLQQIRFQTSGKKKGNIKSIALWFIGQRKPQQKTYQIFYMSLCVIFEEKITILVKYKG